MSYALAMRDQPQIGATQASASTSEQTVFVIDDDPGIRHAVGLLLDSVGHPCQVFASADDYLNASPADNSGCLVCDIRMPGMNGLELQRELIKRGSTLPIIFITGHGDIPMAVEAMQKGAISFIQKPFRDQELLDDIGIALERDRAQQLDAQTREEIGERIEQLTKREREVMDLVVAGKPNKVVAYELDVSQRTIEIHRARVMEKMHARSLAELVRAHLIYFGR